LIEKMSLVFLPEDNYELDVSNFISILFESKTCTDLGPFFNTYLANRSRYYDYSQDDISVDNSLDSLDELVLRLLAEQSSKFSSKSLADILDGSSLFDLSSLYAMSNPSSVSQALKRLLEPPPCAPLCNKLVSSLQAVADILSKDIPRGIAEAITGKGNQKTNQLIDLAAYACDVLHGTSRLLSLSSRSCFLIFPFSDSTTSVPDGYTALFPAKATPSQLPLLGAIVASYECLLPVLMFLLGSSVKGKTLLHLKLALHSSLLAVNSVLESVYFSELRSIRSSGGETRTFIASSRAKACAPALCSILSLLASHKPFDLFSGLSIPLEAHSYRHASLPCFFFQDLARIFLLQDVVQPLLNASAAANILDNTQRAQVVKLFTTSKEDKTDRPEITKTNVVEPSIADILSVKEILPSATDSSIRFALALVGGDVSLAVERLLIDPVSCENQKTFTQSNTSTLDSDIRESTLALARRQEMDDEAKALRISTKQKSPNNFVPTSTRISINQSISSRDQTISTIATSRFIEQDKLDEVDYVINVESLVDNLLYEDEMVDDFDEAGFDICDGGLIGEEARGVQVSNVSSLGPAGKGQRELYDGAKDENDEEDIDSGLVNYRSDTSLSTTRLHVNSSSGDQRTHIIDGHGPRAAGGLTKRSANRKTQRGNAHRGGRGGMKRMPMPMTISM
jgi:hypothetical protein